MGSTLLDRVFTRLAKNKEAVFTSVLFLEDPKAEPMSGVHG